MTLLKQLLLLLLVTVFLAGCDTVTSLQLVGEQPVSLKAEDWQGAWVIEDDAVYIKVVDPAKGELLLYSIELDKAKPEDVMQIYKLYVRQSGSEYYINVLNTEAKPADYFFARISRDGNKILSYLPSHNFFLNNVKTGVLQANMDTGGSTIVLKGSSKSINQFISSNADAFEKTSTPAFTKLVTQKR